MSKKSSKRLTKKDLQRIMRPSVLDEHGRSPYPNKTIFDISLLERIIYSLLRSNCGQMQERQSSVDCRSCVVHMVEVEGFEPTTSCLQSRRSPSELHPRALEECNRQMELRQGLSGAPSSAVYSKFHSRQSQPLLLWGL